MPFGHIKQTIVILVAVTTILFGGMSLIDQIDAFGIKRMVISIDNNDQEISKLKILLENHKTTLRHIDQKLYAVSADITWIKNHLIETNP